MRISRQLLALLALLSALPACAEDWNPAVTHGIVVGVLEWKDSSLSSFSARMRKDKELHRLLEKRGVPQNRLVLLLDRDATKYAIEKQLRETASQTSADSVLFFYYAGHGLKDAAGVYIANYDIDASNPAPTGVSIRRIAEIIAAHFKGKTVIFSGDFCYSGAFDEALQILGARGKRGILIASSSASNESTENWTFSQAFIDCMAGSPFCDKNADGRITLGEVNEEIGQIMKARERQKHGFKLIGVTSDWVFARANRSRPPNGGDFVMAPYNGEMLPARILNIQGQRVQCEFYFYSEKKVIWLAASQTQALRFRSYVLGSNVWVLWHGQRYPARVLKEEGGLHLITYTGYDSSWDEWVMDNRIAAGP